LSYDETEALTQGEKGVGNVTGAIDTLDYICMFIYLLNIKYIL